MLKPRRRRPPAGSVCGLHPWQHRLAGREAGPGIGSGDEEISNCSEVFGLGIVFITARHDGPWSDVSSSLDFLDCSSPMALDMVISLSTFFWICSQTGERPLDTLARFDNAAGAGRSCWSVYWPPEKP